MGLAPIILFTVNILYAAFLYGVLNIAVVIRFMPKEDKPKRDEEINYYFLLFEVRLDTFIPKQSV